MSRKKLHGPKDVQSHCSSTVLCKYEKPLIIFSAINNGVDARRGGGRGGGRRGGGSGRGRGKTSSATVSSKTKAAIRRYKGPTYSSSDWKTGKAVTTVWGVASYMKYSSTYKSYPDRGKKINV